MADSRTTQAESNASILGAITTLLASGAFVLVPNLACAFVLYPATDATGQHFGDLLPQWWAIVSSPSSSDNESSEEDYEAYLHPHRAIESDDHSSNASY